MITEKLGHAVIDAPGTNKLIPFSNKFIFACLNEWKHLNSKVCLFFAQNLHNANIYGIFLKIALTKFALIKFA